MKNSLEFSLRSFAPILVILLPPLLFLLPIGRIKFLLAALDEFSSLTSALQFSLWGLGPILFSILLIWSGKETITHFQDLASRIALITIYWVMFTAALYLVLWFDLTLIGSISASDKPLSAYLRTTAQMAGVLTLIGQVGVIPWLAFALNNFPVSFRPIN